tara:strand:+ start:143 stop:295 length:153 start_codon:yes stop_codon:yes gene_type:complete
MKKQGEQISVDEIIKLIKESRKRRTSLLASQDKPNDKDYIIIEDDERGKK